METLESSRVCRLCGKQSGISINIFDEKENHVRKINAVLPILVHKMDMLPKHMCHRCSYKLEEFHKFYVECLKTDADLKSQLSWMRKEEFTENLGAPMVHIENIKIKTEPPEYDIYDLDPIAENVNYINSMSSVSYPVNNNSRTDEMHERLSYSNFDNCTRCKCDFDQNNSTDEVLSNEECARTRPAYIVREGSNRNNHSISNRIISEDTKIHSESTTEVQGNNNESESYDDAKRSSSCTGITTSTRNAVVVCTKTVRNLKIDRKLKNAPETCKLRPSRRSVDYDGNKKTIGTISTLCVEKLNRNIKANEDFEATNTDDVIANMKQEPPDCVERRILRPRKSKVDYVETDRRRSSRREKDTISDTVINEYYYKRRKIQEGTGNGSSGQSRITESVTTQIEKVDEYENCTADMHISKGALMTSKQNCVKNLMKSFDSITRNVIVKLEQCVPPSRVIIDDKKGNSSYNIIGQKKLLSNVAKKKRKSEEIALKRAAKINHDFSPKSLRSQDAQLRNGKILSYGSITRSSKNSKRNILSPTRNNSVKNVSASVKSLINIKCYCEKCNLKFPNKELYKLHTCYYD